MIVGIILAVLAVVLFVVGVLGWTRRLPGNKFVGLRIPEVRKNKQVWDDAHHVAGPVWMVAAASLGVGAMLAFATSNIVWLWILVALAVVGALVLISLGANFGAQTALVLDKHIADSEAAASGCCSAGGSGGSDLDGVAMPNDDSICGTDGGCGSCTSDCASKFAPKEQAAAPAPKDAAPQIDLDAVRRAASAKDA